jgi:ubiquitin carboxyl-terminal hydrolase 8
MQLNNNKHHHRSKSAGHIKINKTIVIHLQHANGLENVGATCYMNATLQCLANIKQLTEYFIKDENTQKILSNPIKYKLSNSYLEVLNNLWLNLRIKSYAPNDFKTLISDMNPLFAGIQANDSKDLVLFLLETMHNELNTAEKINPSNAILNQYDFETTLKLFVKFFKNNYKSIFSDIFYGMYNSMMTCLNCRKTTHNVQCYNILIFPLEEVRKYKNRIQNIVDIKECFEYYQKDDHMSGANQIFCNNCHAMSNSINKSKLIVCPNVLVINLNRGKGLQFDIKIKFEEYLDIKEFIYNDKSPSYYELVGIVTHFGPSSMGGHFIAFCKSFMDQNWYKYNDALVNISSFQEASTT